MLILIVFINFFRLNNSSHVALSKIDIYNTYKCINSMNPNNEIEYGAGCLGIIWENIAKKIVNEAIRIYNATPEQAAALKEAFLKKGIYKVEFSG